MSIKRNRFFLSRLALSRYLAQTGPDLAFWETENSTQGRLYWKMPIEHFVWAQLASPASFLKFKISWRNQNLEILSVRFFLSCFNWREKIRPRETQDTVEFMKPAIYFEVFSRCEFRYILVTFNYFYVAHEVNLTYNLKASVSHLVKSGYFHLIYSVTVIKIIADGKVFGLKPFQRSIEFW